MTEQTPAQPSGPAPELTEEELDLLRSMFELARTGRTEELTAWVDKGVPVNLTNSSGDSLLMLAAYHKHADTVEALLARGADTERVNDRGQTALGAAVFRQEARIVQALLDAGADPDGGLRTPRSFVEFFGLPEMGALLDAAPPRER